MSASIRGAYRREEIDAETVRHLTMASKAQRKAWLALFDDPEQYAPRGFQLKQWLFGGQSIPTCVALFAVEDYPGRHWHADDAFLDLIRDKAVINAMLAEVAGKPVADGNVAEKAKTQKKVIRDCLDGTNGRAKVEGWLPGWMSFPVRTYTESRSLKTAEEWARVCDLLPTA